MDNVFGKCSPLRIKFFATVYVYILDIDKHA